MKEAIYIEIHWDDGSKSLAVGEAASQIMRWYQSGELMNCAHGAVYAGPQFTVVPAPEKTP